MPLGDLMSLGLTKSSGQVKFEFVSNLNELKNPRAKHESVY